MAALVPQSDLESLGPRDHILLTGGTGFFGLALLRHMASLGKAAPRLTVLSRDPARLAARHPQLAALVHWLQGNVLLAQELPHGKRFSHVLHAAADSTLGPQLSPLQRYDQIVGGTRQMLDYALACGARRFLLTSSGGVYGRLPTGMVAVPETYHGMPDPLDPQQAYGVAKRAAEHLCALYGQSSDLDVVIARCFAFVGPDLPLDVHFAIGNFVRDALSQNVISIQGDGSALRSYMDQRDLAHWLIKLLDKGVSGEAYNVGSDEAMSMSALAYLIRDLLAPGKPVQILGSGRENQDRSIYVPNIQKMKREFGLGVAVPLIAAIKYMARSIIANRTSATQRHEG